MPPAGRDEKLCLCCSNGTRFVCAGADREKNRAFSLVLGIPCVMGARFVNCVLSRDGWNGICPRIAPALRRSAAEARTKFVLLTAARPNSPARMLVTPFITRALRYTFVTLMLFTTVTPRYPP